MKHEQVSQEIYWAVEHGENSKVDKLIDQLKGENINLLSESEWRMIHNALSIEQAQLSSYYTAQAEWSVNQRQKIQQLMDKVRDNYIAPYEKPIW